MQQLTGWFLFLLSVAGHTEWWVVAVNRSHATPIRPQWLRKFRALHDISVLGYPILLLWILGFEEKSLLMGGPFSEQPPYVRILLWATMAGCIPLLMGIFRWHFLRHSKFHSVDSRKRHDVALQATTDAELKDVKGPRRHPSQWWPWNEIYHLEVNTKSIHPPRRMIEHASSRTPIRIVHLSDMHVIGCPGERYYRFVVSQAAAMRADAYVFTGDLIDEMNLLSSAIEILRPLTELAPCYFILGNHDWKYDFVRVRSELCAAGWRCVTGTAEIVSLKGRQILLAGSERPWMGELPPIVAEAGCDLSILLSHSPDQLRFAQRCGYDVMLSGHTHGGQVVLPLIGPVYSPSIYGVSFVSGLFQIGDLVMHVSRGIGAKDPMRWRCCPELTCLEVYC
jgi:predicted MPP superfamily phosphohydrolase